MIIAINYATWNYRLAQRMNSRQARKFGADIVREYSIKDLDRQFVNQNKEILNQARGGGCWLWKPYILLNALEQAKEGDYVIYTDSGSAFVEPISLLLQSLEESGQSIMVFCNDKMEYQYSKRDAFILLGVDEERIAFSNQICGGYIIIRKNEENVAFVKEYLDFCCDKRIITDADNVLGQENYEGFVENRHDQTVLSLLCKKRGILPFRDPSQWGNNSEVFTKEVLERSRYPQVIESHRKSRIFSTKQLKYYK